jgi:hypothetical protein
MQTSDGPYPYTIGAMARVARFTGADQDSEQAIQRCGQGSQRIRARAGAATSGLAITSPWRSEYPFGPPIVLWPDRGGS